MKIDLSILIKGLTALPHTPPPDLKNVPTYVLTHILESLKTDMAVSFIGLDFDAFTEEDLDNLCDAWSEIEAREHQLDCLRITFCNSKSMAASQRKFC